MEGSRRSSRTYRLFVSTWNVGGLLPSDDDVAELEAWLDIKNSFYDIYVLGFQEVVPLNARNVLGPKKRRVLERWSSLIRNALNKLPSSSKLHQGNQKVHPMKEEEEEEGEGEEEEEQGEGDQFECVASEQMVGILVSVWARSDLRRCISHRSIACVGCGVMGCLGNKGSISIRFLLHGTSFCFACCHFASGGREGDEVKRNTNAMDILSRTTFPSSPHKITDHDRVFLFGDLNYRISLPNASTRSFVDQNHWTILLHNDQLRMEVSKGKLFEAWQEGAITFSPTYKYYLNSDKYYQCGKSRAPAWCDRILWRGEGLTQERYDRCELRLSDHRPVRGIFTVDVDVPKS